MGFAEFKELWTVINQWKQTFIQFDTDRSGTVQGHELHNAIKSFGKFFYTSVTNCDILLVENQPRDVIQRRMFHGCTAQGVT